MLLRGLRADSFRGQSLAILTIRLLPALAAFLVIILFSRSLTLQQYGTYQNFWTRLLLLNSLSMLGIPAVLLTYHTSFIHRLYRSVKLSQSLLWLLWTSLIGIIFAWLHRDTNIPWLGAGFFFVLYSFNTLTESVLLALQQFRFLLWIAVGYTAVFLCLHFAVLADIFSISDLFNALLVLYIVRTLVSYLYLRSAVGRETMQIEPSDLARFKKLWLSLGVYDMLQMFLRYADKFIISLFLTAEVSAIYFNGAQEIYFLPILLGAVSSAALMQLSGPQSRSNEHIIRLVNRSASVLASVVVPLFFFLLLFRHEIFIWLSAKYLASTGIFAVSILTIPLRAYGFTTILQNQHKANWMTAGALLDLVLAFMLSYPLYRLLGLPGVALSFVVSTYIQALFYLVVTSKVIQVPISLLLPWRNWFFKIIIFGFVFIAAYYLLHLIFGPDLLLAAGCTVLSITVVISLRAELRTTTDNGKAELDAAKKY